MDVLRATLILQLAGFNTKYSFQTMISPWLAVNATTRYRRSDVSGNLTNVSDQRRQVTAPAVDKNGTG